MENNNLEQTKLDAIKVSLQQEGINKIVTNNLALKSLLKDFEESKGNNESNEIEDSNFAREFSRFGREFSKFSREFSRFGRE